MSSLRTKSTAPTLRRRLVGILTLAVVLALALLLIRPDDDHGARTLDEAKGSGAAGTPLLVGASPSRRAPAMAVATSFVVRDLADGSPKSALTLTSHTRDGRAHSHVAGKEGEFDADPASSFSLGTKTWQLANATAVEYEGRPTLWVWRLVPLSGVVRATDPDTPRDLRSVLVEARYAGPATDIGAGDTAPWQLAWLRAHRVPVRVDLGAPTQAGWFRGTMPCVRGYGVRATAIGCENAWSVPDLDPEMLRAHTQLDLRPCATVRGVVRGADGAPLRGAEIRAYVVRRGALDAFSLGRVRLELEDAFTATWQEELDTSVVTAMQRVTSDSSGQFRIPLRKRGTVWLVALASGHRMHEVNLGPVDGESPEVELEVKPSSQKSVRLLRDGNVLANTRFLISDLTHEELQVARSVATNAQGETGADWMQHGREYLILDRGARSSETNRRSLYFTWNGETTLDLARLSTRRN